MYRALGSSCHSKELEALLDKLVALRMDLETVCGISMVRPSTIVSREAVAGACEIVCSAVGDLRSIIRQRDGVGKSPTLARYLVTGGYYA